MRNWIPTDRSPWAIICRDARGEWQFEGVSAKRCVARLKAYWLGRTRRKETRVVRAWIPTR